MQKQKTKKKEKKKHVWVSNSAFILGDAKGCTMYHVYVSLLRWAEVSLFNVKVLTLKVTFDLATWNRQRRVGDRRRCIPYFRAVEAKGTGKGYQSSVVA